MECNHSQFIANVDVQFDGVHRTAILEITCAICHEPFVVMELEEPGNVTSRLAIEPAWNK